jgi:hypothetical protein
MEINNINNNSINDLNTLKNSVNSDNVNPVQIYEHLSNSNSYSINPNISPKRSYLSDNLNQFISSISQGHIDLSNLQIQNKILKDITINIKEIQTSENQEETSTLLQPNIAELMQKYNNISSKTHIEENESRVYFDGILGSIPLSVDEILNDVSKKQENINQTKQIVSEKIQYNETKALDIIGKEVSKNKESKPFQNIDFGKALGDFTSASINNLIGSVAQSQANAIPSNSLKLLS